MKFLNRCILVKTCLINTKLGDFVNLGVLFLPWVPEVFLARFPVSVPPLHTTFASHKQHNSEAFELGTFLTGASSFNSRESRMKADQTSCHANVTVMSSRVSPRVHSKRSSL